MASGSGIFFSNTLIKGVTRAEESEPKIIEEEMLHVAIEALEYAKENAPWNDRTGDARRGLDVHVEWDGLSIVLSMFHTVSYGQWLETIQSGSYAIIMPTLEIYAERIGTGLSETGFDTGE